MRKVHRRLHMLEQLPRFQLAPSLFEHIQSLALQSVSDEHLDVLRTIVKEADAGLFSREWSEQESASFKAWETALEGQATKMGTKSLAEVKRLQRQRQ